MEGEGEEAYIGEDDIAQVITFDSDEEPMESDDEEGQIIPDAEVVDQSTRQFTAHKGDIYSVAWNKTKPSVIATGGGDDVAMIWDLASASADPVHVLKGHTDSVSHVSYSSDGKYLATCGLDAVLKIWDSDTGNLLHSLEGPTESVETCTWHQRGPVVVAGGGDGSSWMWNAQTGAYMGVFSGHSGPIVSVQFTPDGKKLVTASADQTIRVWDPKDASVLHVIKEGQSAVHWHLAPITVMKVHPEREAFVSGGEDGHINITTLGANRPSVFAYKGHKNPDDEVVDEECSIEDLEYLTFLPCVASASLNKTIQIWDLNTLQTRSTLQFDSGVVRVKASKLHPNVLVSGSTDGTISVWDARAAQLVHKYTGHVGSILDLAVEGTTIISGAEDQTVRLWDMKLPPS